MVTKLSTGSYRTANATVVVTTNASTQRSRRSRSSAMCSRMDISPSGLSRRRRQRHRTGARTRAKGGGEGNYAEGPRSSVPPVPVGRLASDLPSSSRLASEMPFLNSLMPSPTLRPIDGSRLAPKMTATTITTQIHSGPGIAPAPLPRPWRVRRPGPSLPSSCPIRAGGTEPHLATDQRPAPRRRPEPRRALPCLGVACRAACRRWRRSPSSAVSWVLASRSWSVGASRSLSSVRLRISAFRLASSRQAVKPTVTSTPSQKMPSRMATTRGGSGVDGQVAAGGLGHGVAQLWRAHRLGVRGQPQHQPDDPGELVRCQLDPQAAVRAPPARQDRQPVGHPRRLRTEVQLALEPLGEGAAPGGFAVGRRVEAGGALELLLGRGDLDHPVQPEQPLAAGPVAVAHHVPVAGGGEHQPGVDLA